MLSVILKLAGIRYHMRPTSPKQSEGEPEELVLQNFRECITESAEPRNFDEVGKRYNMVFSLHLLVQGDLRLA